MNKKSLKFTEALKETQRLTERLRHLHLETAKRLHRSKFQLTLSAPQPPPQKHAS